MIQKQSKTLSQRRKKPYPRKEEFSFDNQKFHTQRAIWSKKHIRTNVSRWVTSRRFIYLNTLQYLPLTFLQISQLTPPPSASLDKDFE